MKIVEVIAEKGSGETLEALAQKVKAVDFRRLEVDNDRMQRYRLCIPDNQLQRVLDRLQSLLGAQPTARILVLPVDISLPVPEDAERRAEDATPAAREAIFSEMEKNSRLDRNYLLLVLLSTVVAAVGLIENNVAVLVGAMVIAPLLGPNLALSFGTALGDRHLVARASVALAAGTALAIAFSALIGFLWPEPIASFELESRTRVGLDSVALALAAGAAGALSITAGVSSVLVGVMVAVALLPPAAAVGLSLGQAQWYAAEGAALLLGINIVCLNIAAKLVLLARGYRPRRFYDKARAKRATLRVLVGWLITLVLLMLLARNV
ncbi:MAG: TIGR00341 family protein [Pseudomonadota bacterium]